MFSLLCDKNRLFTSNRIAGQSHFHKLKERQTERARGGGGYLDLSSDRDVPFYPQKIGTHNSINSEEFLMP